MPKIIAYKQDWIALGYALFAQKGFNGLVIEKIAKQLNCNKSSFYHHFKSKEIFLDAIVNYWILTETEQVILFTKKGSTVHEKWNLFISIAFKNDPYLEFVFYLKRHAIKHKKYQHIIDQIDEKRLNFTENLLQELGFTQQESVIKASIFYKYLIGYHEMIRHKKQPKNYENEVKTELHHFLNIN